MSWLQRLKRFWLHENAAAPQPVEHNPEQTQEFVILNEEIRKRNRATAEQTDRLKQLLEGIKDDR